MAYNHVYIWMMYRAKYSNAKMKYNFLLELKLYLNVSHNLNLLNLLKIQGMECLDSLRDERIKKSYEKD